MQDIVVETVIVGGGQAGVPLARSLAKAGRSVALIEQEHLGGSCVNFGCTPSKALIASANAIAEAKRAGSLGILIPHVDVDFPAVMRRVRSIVADSKGDLDKSFEDTDNPKLIWGHARLDGAVDNRICVRVGTARLLAKKVVLNTGTCSARPPIKGLDHISVIDAENWVSLNQLPRRIIFIGGGYIALEMSQAFRRLGSSVVILQQKQQIAEREDPEIAAALHAALEQDGIEILLNVEMEEVTSTEDGVRVRLGGGRSIDGSHLFLATGRQPNTDDIGLETLNISTDAQGMIMVDEQLRTSADNIWAAGDIRGGAAFTHTAYDDYRTLESFFIGDKSKTRCRIVPYAMFTDPELGRVGLTETEARQNGRKIRVGRRNMTESGKARELGRTEGFIKVIADDETGEILGAAAFCHQGAEIVQLFVELMNSGATTATMKQAVHIHPTFGEAAKNAVVSIVDD